RSPTSAPSCRLLLFRGSRRATAITEREPAAEQDHCRNQEEQEPLFAMNVDRLLALRRCEARDQFANLVEPKVLGVDVHVLALGRLGDALQGLGVEPGHLRLAVLV